MTVIAALLTHRNHLKETVKYFIALILAVFAKEQQLETKLKIIARNHPKQRMGSKNLFPAFFPSLHL